MKLKKFASIGALIALLVSAAFIVGCKQDANSDKSNGGGSNEPTPFTGTWEDSNNIVKLVFDSSNVIFYQRANTSADWASIGTYPYTFSGDTARVTVYGRTYIYVVSGNTLTEKNSGGGIVTGTYHKK